MNVSTENRERMPRGAFLRALYRVGAEETALPPDGGDGTLTREEAADALARFTGERRYLLPYRTGGGRDFADRADVSPDKRYGVDYCAAHGLFTDGEGGLFRPKEPLYREEAEAVLARLGGMIERARTASGLVTFRDMAQMPETVFSNMSSDAVTEAGRTFLRFSPFRPVPREELSFFPRFGSGPQLAPAQTLEAPWFIGLDHAADGVSDSAMEYCRVCLRARPLKDPKLVLSSPVFREEIAPASVGGEEGWTVLLFPIGGAFRRLRQANLTAEWPYASSECRTLREMNARSLNDRYLHLALYPFGDEAEAEADVAYFAFFADREAVLAFRAAAEPDRFTPDEALLGRYVWQEASAERIAGYEAEIARRVREIRETPSALTPEQICGKCYYVSSLHGDDGNDGLSPQTAWRSVTKLIRQTEGEDVVTPLARYRHFEHVPQPGDGVFLERGSVFNAELSTTLEGDYVMWFADGVSYGAYGEGEKPVLSCCVDYEGSRDWIPTEYENVWMLARRLELPPDAEVPGYSDVGNIVVTDHDGKTGYGIKVLAAHPEDPFDGRETDYLGLVSNGFSFYESGGVPWTSPGCLKNELEFFHDWKERRVYLYCSRGNPGEVYRSVILTRKGVGAYGGSDCVIDNLAFRYLGTFGISTENARNLTIENCMFEWTGGAIQGGTTVFGGAVQNWCCCDAVTIRAGYSDQSLDAAFSTQGIASDVTLINDFPVEHCVALHANSSVEIWNYSPEVRLVSNVSIRDNLFGYVGYHFGNRKTAGGKDACILQMGIGSGSDTEHFVFERNLCLYASYCPHWVRPIRARGDAVGVLLRDNVYVTSNRKMFFVTAPGLRGDGIAPERACVPYTEEAIRLLTRLGIERGGRYYYVDGFAFEGEADGVYLPRYWAGEWLKKRRSSAGK
jgi:hypothetical protein